MANHSDTPDYIIGHDQKQFAKLAELKKVLPAYTHSFLEEKAGTNISTAVSYAQDMLLFFRYLQSNNPILSDTKTSDIPLDVLDSLSYKDINEYQMYMSINTENEYANTKGGLARKTATLSSFFHWMVTHEEMMNEPTAGAKRYSKKKDEHEIIRLTPEEVTRLLDAVKNSRIGKEHQQSMLQHTQKRDYAILTLLLHTGIRVSECVALDLDDVIFQENALKVFRKGKKKQTLYFDKQTEEALKDYIETERKEYIGNDEQALFLSSQKNRMAVRSIQHMVKKYAKAILPHKKFSAHKCRSTYGSRLYNQTGDIKLTADVLGHSDVTTTSKYYAASEEEHRRAAARVQLYETTLVENKNEGE